MMVFSKLHGIDFIMERSECGGSNVVVVISNYARTIWTRQALTR
jgi:hypothetical protein